MIMLNFQLNWIQSIFQKIKSELKHIMKLYLYIVI